MQLPRAIWSDTHTLSCGDTAELAGEEFHHLIKVKRIEKGREIEIFHLKDKKFFLAEITEIHKTKLVFQITSLLDKPDLKSVTLLCGLPELPVADRIIEKCGEIGLEKVIFFLANRSQGFSKNKINERRLERWNKIAISAFKQSLQTKILEVVFYESLESAIENINPLNLHKWVLHPESGEGSQSIDFFSSQNPNFPNNTFQNNLNNTKALRTTKPSCKIPLEINDPSAETHIVVGPEGGLSDREFEFLKSNKFRHCNLGRGILRVETAAVLASGIAILGK